MNRRLGRFLASYGYALGLSPNQITALSAGCTFSGLALVALLPPSWWLGLAVAVLLLLGYALDSADGQLARLLGGGSRSGEWLDHFVDAIKVSVFHGVILVSLLRFGEAPAWLLWCVIGFQSVYSIMFFGLIVMDLLRSLTPRNGRAPTSGRRGLVQTLVAVPLDYGLLCALFLVFGWQPGFRAAYVVLFVLNTFLLAGAVAKWWREVKAMDTPASAPLS